MRGAAEAVEEADKSEATEAGTFQMPVEDWVGEASKATEQKK